MKRGARLGQHFLKTRRYARILAERAGAGENSTALEIGPGKGALTEVLLERGAHVVAIEKDEVLAQHLREKFSNEIARKKLRIIEGDVRDFKPEKIGLKAGMYVVAANIPYYITGEIIRTFLSGSAQPKTLALLIQKEVAERIVARKESILSLSVKAYGMPKIAARVPRTHFSPPPSVDSAILVVEDISKKNFKGLSEAQFFDVVRAGFASKRKLLANNLARRFGREDARSAIASCGVAENARAEDVALSAWLRLARDLPTNSPSS